MRADKIFLEALFAGKPNAAIYRMLIGVLGAPEQLRDIQPGALVFERPCTFIVQPRYRGGGQGWPFGSTHGFAAAGGDGGGGGAGRAAGGGGGGGGGAGRATGGGGGGGGGGAGRAAGGGGGGGGGGGARRAAG